MEALQVVHQVIWLVKMRFGETSAGHFITTKGTQDTFLGSEMARWWRGWDAGKLKSSRNSSWDPCYILHLEEPKKMPGIFWSFFSSKGFDLFLFFPWIKQKGWAPKMGISLDVSFSFGSSDSNMKLKREIHEAYTWKISSWSSLACWEWGPTANHQQFFFVSEGISRVWLR